MELKQLNNNGKWFSISTHLASCSLLALVLVFVLCGIGVAQSVPDDSPADVLPGLADFEQDKIDERLFDWLTGRETLVGEFSSSESEAGVTLLHVDVHVDSVTAELESFEGLFALGITDTFFSPLLTGHVTRDQLTALARDTRVVTIVPVELGDVFDKVSESIAAWLRGEECTRSNGCWDPRGLLEGQPTASGEPTIHVNIHLYEWPDAEDVPYWERYDMWPITPLWGAHLTARQIIELAGDPRVRSLSPVRMSTYF